MTDENAVSEEETTIPEPPTPPSAPSVVEVPDEPETPEGPAEGTEEGAGDQEPEGASEDASEAPAGDPETAEDTTPTLVSDEQGQRLVYPDGKEVWTRTHPYPVSNSEWEKYEVTHSGDQARYNYVPGDKAYSPYADPSIPNSQIAQQVEREIQGYAERLGMDSEAKVSPMWEAFQPMYEGELKQAIATGGGNSEVEA